MVVGAGMAGASVAAELSERLSVVVVEAAASGEEHSTGRSAAAFLPSYGSAGVRALDRRARARFGVECRRRCSRCRRGPSMYDSSSARVSRS
ncbi:FAD-dependent oxidoreductase [Streptomyces sp. NPDC048171]|uniref:FAD-dependent oxidoreductase n=1 Tax=Streptomyces sp. NPDC048171 TaxID=3365504 RepID=UPI003721B47A